MRILGQKLSDGSVEVFEAPDPVISEGFVRVRTLYSAISAGTEGGKVITGKKSLIGKARAKPEQAKQAQQMIRSLGLKNTIRKVKSGRWMIFPIKERAPERYPHSPPQISILD